MDNLPPLPSSTGGLPSGIQPPSTKRSGGCLKGCFFSLVLCIIVCAAGAYLVIQYAGPLISRSSAALLDTVTKEFVTTLPIPPSDRARLEAELRKFSAEVRSGNIGVGQVAQIAQGLSSGSFVPQVLGLSFKELYLRSSGLSPAEKAQGEVVVRKFLAGVTQNRISQDDAASILKVLTASGSEGEKHLKQRLTDAEIRQALAQMDRMAQAAGVGDAPAEVNLIEQLRQALTQSR